MMIGTPYDGYVRRLAMFYMNQKNCNYIIIDVFVIFNNIDFISIKI